MILTFSTAREWEEKNHPSVHANILSAKGPCWLMATAITSKRAISIIGFWIRWRPLALNSSLRTKMSNYPFYSTLPFVCSHKLASFLPDIREKKNHLSPYGTSVWILSMAANLPKRNRFPQENTAPAPHQRAVSSVIATRAIPQPYFSWSLHLPSSSNSRWVLAQLEITD